MGTRLMAYDKVDSKWVFYLNNYRIKAFLDLLGKETPILIRSFYGEGDETAYSTDDMVKLTNINELMSFLSSRGSFFETNKLMFDIESAYTINFNDNYECQVSSNLSISENDLVKKVLRALGYTSQVLEYLTENVGSYILINQDSTLEKAFRNFDDYVEYEQA